MSAGGFADPRLSRGDPGDPMHARLAGAVDAARPQPGAGLIADAGFGGVAIAARRQRRVATARRHPFQVFPVEQTRDEDGHLEVFKVRIERGTVLQGDRWDGAVEIGDLTAEHELEPADKLWIRCDFDSDGVLGTALVENGGGGEEPAWEGYPQAYALDEESGGSTWWQLLAFLRVAEEDEAPDVTFAESTGIPQEERRQVLVQSTTTHLKTTWMCGSNEDRDRFMALMPWAGAIPPVEEEEP